MDEREEKLTHLMNTHWQGVWAFIYAQMKDTSITDDLTQDVFVNAYLHLDEFRHQSTHKTWLFSIAKNRCRDYRKSAVFRRVVPMAQLIGRSADAAIAASPEDEVLQDIAQHELWTSVLKLKQSWREVVVLHLREDMTFGQVGEVLEIAEGTARARYRRAVEQLRRQMHGGGE